MAVTAALGATLLAQEQPRFRSDANLVRVDIYVSAGGASVSDLSVDDFEVLEDGVPQRIQSFQLMRRAGGQRTAATPVDANRAAGVRERVVSSLRGTAWRRGPSTGLAYVTSQETTYRRTERLRFEVPMSSGKKVVARLLGPAGAPLNVPIGISSRTDDASGQTILVADLTLAPLAQGEYELELILDGESGPEVVPYRFALIP